MARGRYTVAEVIAELQQLPGYWLVDASEIVIELHRYRNLVPANSDADAVIGEATTVVIGHG